MIQNGKIRSGKVSCVWSGVFGVLIGCFLSCSSTVSDIVSDDQIIPPGKTPKDGVFIQRGDHSFVYNDYSPLADKPVTVHYYIPQAGDIEDMPVLFSFHGAERDGTIQRNAWKYFAEEHGFIVLAPEFSHANGYNENDYQFGGMFTTASFRELHPSEKWTYQIVEALFDYFKKETDSKALTYNMFGHSAGGQFVHRFVLTMPNARVNTAVAANPGSWSFPHIDGIIGTDGKPYGWPMSVQNTAFANTNALTQFFSKKLWIHLGQLDTDVNDSSLPKDAPANAQGEHRLARGRLFYNESQRIATELGVPFSFRIAEVEQAGHSTIRMVYGRAVPDPKNIVNTGENCAFDLIFR